MPDEGIGTKVSVLGDKEYKAALADIGRQLTVLNTNMAATQSAFDDQGDAMDALRSKSASLQSIYEVQAQKVKLISEQLEKAKQDYGENSKQVDNLQIALNRAQTAMNKTGSEIRDTERKLDDMESALDDSADASDGLKTSADKAATAVADEGTAADDAEEKNTALGDAMGSVGEIAGGALKVALEAAAAAVAALATAAVAGGKHLWELGDDYQQAVGQLSAQTGATGDELNELGSIAEQVYRDNFGGSLNDVATSMATVKTNTGLMGDELKAATENSYALRDTFGMEFEESSRAASALMKRFGLSADEAYNLIAVGAQKGANQNGDLLDVISEYAPKYAEMGLTADQMMQTFINGAENGVFQIDKVGDAVKEFSIRAIDGSDSTKEAFKALGLNATYMAAEIAEGGPVAENAFREVVAALMKVEDPIKRNTIAVALFGTQYEDLGQAALPILAGITDTSDTAVDALSQINEVKYNNLSDALGGVKRQIEGEFMPLAKTMSQTATDALNDISTALSDGFQPEDIRVIGESIATALMDGISLLDTLLNENMGMVNEALAAAVAVVVEALPALVDAILPAAMGLLQSIVDAVTANIEPLTALAASIVTNVAAFLVENTAALIGAATSLVTGLVDGISAALPQLLPAAASMVTELVTGLAAALPDILASGTGLIENLVNGINAALPTLTAALPQIVTAILTALTEALPQILTQGAAILTSLITGLVGAIPDLVAALPQIVTAIWDGITAIDWGTLGLNLIQGLVDGLTAAVASLMESIKNVFVSIWDAIKGVFGINSPSTVAAEAGGFILDGLIAGFEEAVTAACEAVKRIFGKIWDAIKSIFGFGGESDESKEAKEAGQDIMGGIKDGITGSETDLETAVKNAAQKALTKFETEFGVTEGNSTKTKPYGEGLAKGINDGLSGVTESTFSTGATNVFTAVGDAINTAFGVSGTGFLGMGANSAEKFKSIGEAICKAIADGISSNNNNTEAVKTAITSIANAAYTQAVAEMASGITGGTDTVNAAVDEVAGAALDAAEKILSKTAGTELGKNWTTGVKAGIINMRSQLVNTTTQVMKAAHTAARAAISQQLGQNVGRTFATGVRDGIQSQRGQVTGAASGLGSAALSALWGAIGSGGSKFNAIGAAIASGVARGIRNNQSVITSAAKNAAQAAYNAAKSTLKIASPSKVMAEIGEHYDEGFAQGIERGMAGVLESARALSALAADETQGGAGFTSVQAQGQSIDYGRLGDAVADSFQRRGMGRTVVQMDKRIVGESVEPSVSRATQQRANRSVAGRSARMVLA